MPPLGSCLIMFVSVLFLFSVTAALREQSIAVKGRLMCGPLPATNVRVKLWDEDTGPDADDLLDQNYTDKNGDFHLSGGTIEMTPIDPILKVYHDCNDDILPGHRKVKFTLPDKYITNGVVPNVTMDVGVINLELEFMKEEREFFIS